MIDAIQACFISQKTAFLSGFLCRLNKILLV